jgi:sugar lactone lactonase YvrE
MVAAVTLLTAAALAAAAGPSVAAAHHPQQGDVAKAKPKRAPYGSLFVVSAPAENDLPGAASIEEFTPRAHGNAAPVATISGSKTSLVTPGQAAMTRSGWLLVTEPSANAIDEFAPGAHGNVAPSRRIVGAKTLMNAPDGIAVARNGAIWIASGPTQDNSFIALEEFAPGAHGNAAPVRVIAGDKTLLYPAEGIALTPDGRDVWVTHYGETITGPFDAQLEEFATTQHGNVAPVRTVAGADVKLQFPVGVVVNPAGDVVVADADWAETSSGAITTFAPKAHGDAQPTRFVAGSNTRMKSAGQITLDATGSTWLASPDSNALVRFGPKATGNVAPSRRLAGARTGLDNPVAVTDYVVAPSKPRGLTAASKSHHRLQLRWRAPSSTGGGVLGYDVFRKSGKHGKWKLIAAPAGRAYVANGVSSRTRYSFRVTAYNTAGGSKPSAAVVG